MDILSKHIPTQMSSNIYKISQVSKSDSSDPLELRHVPDTRNHCHLPLCKPRIWSAG